jgi:hypothetical protein
MYLSAPEMKAQLAEAQAKVKAAEAAARILIRSQQKEV